MPYSIDLERIAIPLLFSFLAGSATLIGGCLSFFFKKFEAKWLTFCLGLSAGVMIYISFAELLAEAVQDAGFLLANIAFFVGIVFIMLIDLVIPHSYIAEKAGADKKNGKLMSVGIFAALGIAIHNFPEGMAVFLGSFESVGLGIPLLIAIAIHNIPEGLAVAVPIFYATKSRRKSLWLTFLSGISEPIGALVGFFILSPFLTPAVLSLVLAGVAGIMVYISLDELLPACFKNGGCDSHAPIIGATLGMAIMCLSLYLLEVL